MAGGLAISAVARKIAASEPILSLDGLRGLHSQDNPAPLPVVVASPGCCRVPYRSQPDDDVRCDRSRSYTHPKSGRTTLRCSLLHPSRPLTFSSNRDIHPHDRVMAGIPFVARRPGPGGFEGRPEAVERVRMENHLESRLERRK